MEIEDKDPFSEFGGKKTQAPTITKSDPFSEFGGVIQKKKDSLNGGSTTSQPSNNGSNPSLPFQQSTNSFLNPTQPQQPYTPDFLTKEGKDEYLKNTKPVDSKSGINIPNTNIKLDGNQVIENLKKQRQNQIDQTNDPNSQYYKDLAQDEADVKSNDKGSWKNIGSFAPDKILSGLGHDVASGVTGLGNVLPNSINTPFLKPALINLGASLEANASKHDVAASNETLPNTATGNLVSSGIGFVPDLIELAGAPELKLGKAVDIIAKYGGKYAPKIAEMAGGKFANLMSTKGFLNGYNESKANGDTDTQAWGNGLVGAAKEWPKAMIFEAAGELGHGLTKSGIKAGEEAGLISANKFVAGAEKRLVHSAAQGLAFSTVPIVTNAMQGKGTSFDEIKQNGLFGAVLGGVMGDKGAKGETTPADVAAQQIIKQRPQIDLDNFMNADMDAIKAAHHTESTPADLQMMSAVEADNAFKESDPDKKQQAVIQSSVMGKLSGVKSIVNSILSDKKGFIDGIQQSDMPDEQKHALIQKAEDVTHELHPDEIAKRGLATKIQGIDEQLPQLTEMVNQATDPLSKATAETAVEKLTEEKSDAEKELKGIIGNQMDNIHTPLLEVKSEPIEVTKPLELPTEQQKTDDLKNKNYVSFTYGDEKDVPDILKDHISSTSEVNGKKEVRVTLLKSDADYFLDKTKREGLSEPEVNDNAKPEVPEAELPLNTEENGVATSKTGISDAQKEESSKEESSQEEKGTEKENAKDGNEESLLKNSGEAKVEPDNLTKAGDPLRKLADKIREGKIKKLGSFKSHTPGSLVWDGSLEAVAKAIDGGAKIADAIQAGIDHIKASDWYKGLSKDEQQSIIDEYEPHMQGQLHEDKEDVPEKTTGTTGITKEDVKAKELKGSSGEVKKTILTTRAYEGEIQDDVKEYLEKKGLTRASFSQEERSKQATDFINKFGEDAAFQAVKSGDVDGGMAASMLAQLQIRNSHEMAEWPVGTDERDAMAKKQANYIELAEKKGYLGGEFNGQLAYEYQNAELDYANVKKQVEKATGKPLTPEQEKNIKKITDENERLKKQLKDVESKLIDETDKALDGKDKPEKPTKPKTEYAKKALDAVVKVRAKIRANSYSDATGMIALVDTGLGVIETSIRAGITVSKAIEKGIEHIKSELKKRGIDTWEKEDDFRKDVTDAFEVEGVKDTATESDATKKQQANIKRLEKELADAKENRTKDKGEKRELSDEEKDLVDQIKKEKLRIKLENLQTQFVDKKDNKFTASESKDIWDYMKGNYIENGTPYRDAISKIADDLGLSWRQVNEAITTPKNKSISDDMWKRQSDYARNNASIRDWVEGQNKSAAFRALKKVSGLFRGVAVFGHGAIFVGTHAGMTFFNPTTWNKTIPAFFNAWKFSYGNEANYHRSMEELKNSPNYTMAQRAGLKNNPERLNAEEYQRSQKYLGRLGTAGERGFNAIKVLRQGLFDYHYSKLTPAERDDPTVAQSIAHLVNLATGATNIKMPPWVNEAAFAGGMEAARWEKLTASPLKATFTLFNTLFKPEKASISDRVFAKVWARRVGEQLATYSALLAANAAIQNTLNPKNKVNMTNPDKPDFMKFKFGDMTIDPTSGMRSAAMFVYTLGKIPFQDKEERYGKTVPHAFENAVGGYARGKLAPLYATVVDFYSGQDYSGNIMPYSDNNPSRNAHNLTWPEYAWSKAPLPIAEAAGVFYKSALEHGAHKKTLDDVLKGIMAGGISGATGFRVGEYKGDEK